MIDPPLLARKIMSNVGSSKRKTVDDAFRRMFGYEWGTHFWFDVTGASASESELVSIFGVPRAARIIESTCPAKRRKTELESVSNCPEYQEITLPSVPGKMASMVSSNKNSNNVPHTLTEKQSNLDSVLSRLAGSSNFSTVKKTSEDWEAFKETDKQLQDDLERQAQGKDAYLVKKDFLSRVDNRKFEIERQGRDKERTRKSMQG